MGIENTTTIAGLVATNPPNSDPVYEGPEHFKLIKRVLKGIFPGSAGEGFAQPIVASEADLNASSGLSTAEATRGRTLATIITDIYSKLGGGSSGGGGGTPPPAAQAFPVGSVYMTYMPDNPAQLLGYGTWSKTAQGKFIAGVDPSDPSFDVVGKTGGSKHGIIPEHRHTIPVSSVPDSNANGFILKHTSVHMGDTGSTAPVVTDIPSGSAQVTNANLPPYITCFIWKRDA